MGKSGGKIPIRHLRRNVSLQIILIICTFRNVNWINNRYNRSISIRHHCTCDSQQLQGGFIIFIALRPRAKHKKSITNRNFSIHLRNTRFKSANTVFALNCITLRTTTTLLQLQLDTETLAEVELSIAHIPKIAATLDSLAAEQQQQAAAGWPDQWSLSQPRQTVWQTHSGRPHPPTATSDLCAGDQY